MIYMDNAATTKLNEVALQKANVYLTEKYYNPSALYREGFELNMELEATRKKLVSYVADSDEFELIFTSCGTESDNTAVFNYGRRGNIVTTEGEHSAIISSVNEMKNRGVEVRIAPLNSDSSVNVEKLLELVDEKTSLVSVMHVNNETGAVNDINAIAKAVKEKNKRVIFHSDGVQAFGKLPFKLNKNVDLYSLSAHKIGGLKGVGALIKRKTLQFNPFIYGGGQEKGRRSGTENVFGIKTLEYAAEEKFKNLKNDNIRFEEYKKYFKENLNSQIFDIISSDNAIPCILCLSAKKCRGEILLHMVNDKGLIIGTGSACSSNSKNRYSRVILACGYGESVADTVIRISFSPETTMEEVVSAVEILNNSAEKLAGKMV